MYFSKRKNIKIIIYVVSDLPIRTHTETIFQYKTFLSPSSFWCRILQNQKKILLALGYHSKG